MSSTPATSNLTTTHTSATNGGRPSGGDGGTEELETIFITRAAILDLEKQVTGYELRFPATSIARGGGRRD